MKVLLTHAPQARRQYYGERALAALREIAEVRLNERDEALAPAALIAAAADVDAIIADRLTTGPAEIFRALDSLKAFLRVTVDIRNIDVGAASAAGVLVTRARPGFMTAVAELALGFLVDLARGVSRASADYHAGRAPEVRMGRELAGADYVICLAVATAATENLIDARAFAHMRPQACFVNLSRGNLVDEAALLQALRADRIAGAAMDVGRAADQMPSPELAALPNVIATPHIGGLTPQAVEAQAFDTVRQLAAIGRGEVPAGAVNAEAWTRRSLGMA